MTLHALLLAAGLGTRLRPLTDHLPKPLVPLFDRPLAAYALAELKRAGVTHVVANTHHLAATVDPALRPWAERLGLTFDTRFEPQLLGTGGALRNVLDAMTDPFIVYNGDVLATPDLAGALALHRASDAELTMVLREDPRAARLGAIEVNARGEVLRILGEGETPREPVKSCLFTGIYVVSKRLSGLLPAEGCVVRHTVRRLLSSGRRVAGFVDPGLWHDLGTHAAYAEVHRAALDGALAPLRGYAAENALAAGVTAPAGVSLSGCVLGAGVRVEGAGALRGVIAWPGVTVRAPLENAIVGPFGVVLGEKMVERA
ncbi:MAG: NDP-sugar synthase [Myxococcales bacterium]|nr:NDP-sugar synthase [Myxococcales bacterium]